ncbi:uncharacterized protein V1516DRAFT_675770 [Lipomyces oligophaga]|uniref:uncharacterized protein n=1 Tax=Lipomyces oligophaga TaxID=45792 RepID=UPI0034CD857B
MHFVNLFLVSLFIFSSYVKAATLRGTLETAPGIKYDPSMTKITLRSSTAIHTTTLKRSSSIAAFAFPNVTIGSYMLYVSNPDHIFPVLRVDISDADVAIYQAHRGNDWTVTGPRVAYPIELKPIGPAVYYVPRESFNVLKLFKNPMLLVSLVTLVMVFVMPKMLNSLEPEQLKDLQERHSKNQAVLNNRNPMNFDIASYLAGKTAESTSSEPVAESESTIRSRK